MAEGRSDGFELLELGNRRFDVLERLADGPASKPTLVDDLDVSRSTVNRALRELEEWHLVERTDEGHVPTLSGRLLADALDRYLGDLSTLAEANRLLAELPADTRVPVELLRGAAVHHPTPPSPNRALNLVREHVERADRTRCLVGALADKYAAEFFRNRIEAGMEFEAVFDDDLVSFLLAERRTAIRTYVEGGDVYTVEDIPYSLVITEGDDVACQFVVYDDDGALAGLLVNDDPTAVEWAESTFERYREGATPLAL